MLADTTHRVDQPLRSVLLGLAAEIADVDGEVLRVGSEVVVPDPLIDRRVVEHDPRVADKQLQQVELGLGELESPATPRRDPTGRVDRQVAQLEMIPDLGLGADAPGERPEPREELTQIPTT